MNNIVVYVHGKGGSAEEAAHYKALFPDSEVIGFDYLAQTPWVRSSLCPRWMKRWWIKRFSFLPWWTWRS